MLKKAKKKVIVGLSGGIDSSMAAALLKEQGYDVTGVFLRFWKETKSDPELDGKLEQKAKKIAGILNIHFCVVNVSQKFKKEVAGNFLKETKAGRTPNPCVVCNRKIKFNFLFDKMPEMKAAFVATGHYAKIQKINKKYHLYPASDSEKDQTYFLYNLSQKQLGRILFPLGHYEKTEIKKMAKKRKLPVFDKKESQNLCFTSEKSPNGFIRRNLALSSGDIILSNGQKIGQHKGLELYTIGQRKGINIGGTGPYYVAKRNFQKNQLVVTNNEKDENICQKNMQVKITNWVIKEPKLPAKIKVKIRYRGPEADCVLKRKQVTNGKKQGIIEVEFLKPQKAVTPGQSAVFHGNSGEILGGGTIL